MPSYLKPYKTATLPEPLPFLKLLGPSFIILGLGLVFEIPAIVYFLARLGLITPQFMLRFWRQATVLIFFLAAVISPSTDIPNMMVFALPMEALYFLSVGIAWAFGKERRVREA